MAILGWPYQWVPRREISRLRDEVEQLLSGWERQGKRWLGAEEYPPVNIYSKGDDVIITAELPGLKQEEIDLTITGNSVAIRGERRLEMTDDSARYHRQERRTGSFVRAVQLPEEVDGERAQATYANGILTVTLPRAESSKPRRIQVTEQGGTAP